MVDDNIVFDNNNNSHSPGMDNTNQVVVITMAILRPL